MTEEEYNDLCKFCDDIIFENQTPDRVAISWLHVIREHPVFFIFFNNILLKKNRLTSLLEIFYIFFKYIFLFLKNIRLYKNFFSFNHLNKANIIFISHSLDEKKIKDIDFYFGDISSNIKDKGISSYTALINHSSQKKNIHSKDRILLNNNLGILKELVFFIKLFKQFIEIINIKSRQDKFKNKNLIFRAAVEALSPSSFASLRISDQVKDIVTKTDPSLLIFTFEGHAWERVAMSIVRKINKNIKCIGYQHAALFRKQYAINRRLSNKYNPDHILTCGEVTRKRLSNNPFLKNITVSTLGSNRAIKLENFPSYYEKKGLNNNKTCLVLPEGYESESQLLFNFAINSALKNKNIYFILRLHPILDFKKLKNNNDKLKYLPDNVIFSNESLAYDINRSSYALYRGSTSIVQSILGGLIPIYFRSKNEMTINPLYEVNEYIINVSTSNELIDAINKKINYEKNLLSYCSLFYQKLNYNEVYKLFSN